MLSFGIFQPVLIDVSWIDELFKECWNPNNLIWLCINKTSIYTTNLWNIHLSTCSLQNENLQIKTELLDLFSLGLYLAFMFIQQRIKSCKICLSAAEFFENICWFIRVMIFTFQISNFLEQFTLNKVKDSLWNPKTLKTVDWKSKALYLLFTVKAGK